MPNAALATLPISMFVVGMAASTLPAGAIARRHGRLAAFLMGTGYGVLGGVVAAFATVIGSFWLYCVATFFGGAYASVVASFRFAAADCVSPERRPHALSFVMAGGVFAGVIGPQLVNNTMYLWMPHIFAASYLAQAAVAAISALLLLGIRLPKPPAGEAAGGRPLSIIARQPRFITAVICGVVSYLLMNFLMTAAPLAMRLCGLSQESSNLAIQWHVIAMYLPGFFTGRLITLFGAPRVVMSGLVLMGISAALALTGVDVAHFWVALTVLGIGWNFGFVGASALVLECHRPEERASVQSLNDFAVFGTMTFGSFLSGGLLTAYGWNMVLALSFVPLTMAVIALAITPRACSAQA
uniref:Putative permease/facilitator n=1 Tax=Mesorhizobium plurifarium TaxID=69974 RepID=I2AWI5_MESPL|nr:putative permease/facilitator [Mesorhizobium plurifarium]